VKETMFFRPAIACAPGATPLLGQGVVRGWLVCRSRTVVENAMATYLTPFRAIAAGIGFLVVLFAVGWVTREDPAEKPYLKVLGGGFMFNYRVADVYYGFTAAVQKPLSTGSIIEARFEDPGGGSPHVVRVRVGTATNRYVLRSPPVRGVEAGQPYGVDVIIYDRSGREELWRDRLTFTSRISDGVVPERPLTIGPGYTPNPDG
jgi:hypothetical protein